jgi:nitrogen fixation protein FixH
MATDNISIREGTTSDIEMQLLSGNSAIDLTGINHLELEMRDSKRKVYKYKTTDTTPYISIVSATEGKVKFTPPNNKIFLATNSPYYGYWIIYETASKDYTVPEDSEFTIKVREDF